jgi:hypothetical protein
MTTRIIASILLAATLAVAAPIVLVPSGPISQAQSPAIWTAGNITGAQAYGLFTGTPLAAMLDMSQCPTNDHHIVVCNVNLTNRTYAAISPANTNAIGKVTLMWWPDVSP